ncbi:hypothetical protein PFICI_00139 [Pestalotiopsis fici W106-1]|uniref:Helicase ATP-binding domain-containing protein n=1 Tax=Pestalotiopsis fici (strain W106-1 / CGMCC3.15140) TaxID=1229662 RepID=W3XM28_PESFW|nr:uncharacterized protein PFICI_00139 [Pestalotiopsis fici W106-1]ETS86311.1 hypothetical protein PFICI_00139 [Pestalotiopsis fici W106-1]
MQRGTMDCGNDWDRPPKRARLAERETDAANSLTLMQQNTRLAPLQSLGAHASASNESRQLEGQLPLWTAYAEQTSHVHFPYQHSSQPQSLQNFWNAPEFGANLDQPSQRPPRGSGQPRNDGHQPTAALSYNTHASPATAPSNEFLSVADDSRQVESPTIPLGIYETSSAVDIDVDSNHQICCFGMIPDITGSFECLGIQAVQSPFDVNVESAQKFSSEEYQVNGRIDTKHSYMIQELLDVHINIKVICIAKTTSTTKKARSNVSVPCELQLTIYGDLELFDEVGEWLQGSDIYLQDPMVCHMDVKYCNPHRLSFIDIHSCPMVSDIVKGKPGLMFRTISERSSLLDTISNVIDLQEAPQPPAVKSSLKRHQKQALYFMSCREQGWGNHHDIPDIWESVDNDRGRIYFNSITEFYQSNVPRQIYGGIIADPMGLGKTLSMIALIAADLDNTSTMEMDEGFERPEGAVAPSIRATLVVVPPPLISAWEEQLSDHLVPGSLSYSRYHGSDKAATRTTLETDRLVLTTYHTVSAEWKQSTDSGDASLFSVRWRRIVLDEAHFIRNANSRMSRAVCALQAQARWAVTGTPIQNRLGDLSSLVKFIRAHPYTDIKQFDADISHLWKSGEDEKAVKRLKRLSSCLVLRRPKTTIELPHRFDLECPVDFTAEEKQAYTSIHQQAIVRIDEVLQSNGASFKSNVFVNVLQQIEALRLFCSLGLRYNTRHRISDSSNAEIDDWNKMAQRTFNTQRQMGPLPCLQCESTIDLTESMYNDGNQLRQEGRFFKCLKFLCVECTRKSTSVLRCGHRPNCPAASVSMDSNGFEDTDDVHVRASIGGSLQFPSKINALVADLKSLPPNTKCIVFSTWRLTLDVVEAALEQAHLPCSRFDGKLPQKDRQGVVDRFRKDSSVRVMLLTLSCGAVGLTLTVASRAYLLEPHWNPTLEEQALARIHRLGQTQEVTTVRLYVRDSFEESVREVQKSKQQLANVLLSSHGEGQSDTSLSVLEEFDETLLRSLDSLSPPKGIDEIAVVKAPQLYEFDREANVQVLEDFTDSGGFRPILFAPDADALRPRPLEIGRHLGTWLRSFHEWALESQQAGLRTQLGQKDPVRKLKCSVTFDVFLKVLETFPELLNGYQETLQAVQAAMTKEFAKPATGEDEGWGLVHGDLWSGNILLSNPPWHEPPRLGIIDWEFAQFGHRSYDLGQIVGDLYEKAVYLKADTKSVMEAIISGYGVVSDDMAFRTAIYVGVHLIGWHHRRPRTAPPVAPEVITAGLKIGRDFICKAWEKDRHFFESTALKSLFTPK